MGQRSMANSLVGGNINSRKTRSLLFVKTEQKSDQAYQGKYQCMVSHLMSKSQEGYHFMYAVLYAIMLVVLVI